MKIVMVASSKGGIGKTTIALGISRALNVRKQKVLLVDLDFSNACLDILAGVSSIYTIADAADGTCDAADAVSKQESGLFVLPTASVMDVDKDDDKKEKYCDVIKKAAESVGADFVILDTGAGISDGFKIACEIADSAVIVATHSPVSIRSAENTALRIKEHGVEDVSLVINSYDVEGVIKYGQHQGLVDIIDQSHIRLIGVVLFDYEIVLDAELDEKAKLSRETLQAFDNIARRVAGEEVPIFTGMKKIRRKRKLLF